MSRKPHKIETNSSIYLIIETYLCFLFLLPFVYSDYYFDISVVKANYYIIITSILAISMVPIFIYKIINKNEKWKLTITDIFMLAFGGILIIGYILSDFKNIAFMGTNNWKIGVVFFVLSIVLYFAISKTMVHIQTFVKFFMFINIIVLTLGILNVLNVDPLGFNGRIAEKDLGDFLSTIGNVDWYGEYIALILPVSAILLLLSDNIINTLVNVIVFELAVINAMLCNSDSVFIILGITALYLIYQFISYPVKRKTIGFITLVSGLCIAISTFIYENISIITKVGSVNKLVCNYYIGVIVTLVGLAIYFLCKSQGFKKKNIIIAWSVLALIFIALVCIIVICNTSDILPKYFNNYFRFSNKWGNNRGYIWGYAIDLWKNGNVIQKLVGFGCDTFGEMVNPLYKTEVYKIWGNGATLVNAHNDMLQLLVCTGLLGVIAYYGAMLSSVINGLKSKGVYANAISLGLLCAVLVGLVNNFQAITLPFLFMYVGFLNNKNINEQ